MSRTRIPLNVFVAALTRNVQSQDLQSNDHLLADYKFGNDGVYPILDRDRGPKHTLSIGPACLEGNSAHCNQANLPNTPYLRLIPRFANVPVREDIKSKFFGHIDEDV